jgi:hypothetical protein
LLNKYSWDLLDADLLIFQTFLSNGKRIRTYKCHYCDAKEGTIYNIVQPCKQKHPENALKYRQIVMDEKTAH